MRRSHFHRVSPRLGAVFGLAAAGVVAALVHGGGGGTLTGRAVAVDGDTLRLAGTRVRLVGLDAPELEQDCTDAAGASWPCGREARAFLSALVAQGDITCTGGGRDAYRRTLAHCSFAGADLGRSIVAAGWAVTQFDYADAERQARAAGTGIWRGSFTTPAEWRRTHGGEPAWWEWIRSWFA